jgi:FixJ family two-component response regulator
MVKTTGTTGLKMRSAQKWSSLLTCSADVGGEMNTHVEQYVLSMTPASKKPCVAIVDDDVLVCRSLKRLLRAHGFAAATFTSSRLFVELIELVPSFKPDCVILDMHMPVLSGFQVLGRLSRYRPTVPVIFLSGDRQRAMRELALASGAVATLQKPVPDGVLIAILRNVLKDEARDGT